MKNKEEKYNATVRCIATLSIPLTEEGISKLQKEYPNDTGEYQEFIKTIDDILYNAAIHNFNGTIWDIDGEIVIKDNVIIAKFLTDIRALYSWNEIDNEHSAYGIYDMELEKTQEEDMIDISIIGPLLIQEITSQKIQYSGYFNISNIRIDYDEDAFYNDDNISYDEPDPYEDERGDY